MVKPDSGEPGSRVRPILSAMSERRLGRLLG